jgi:hypothetical protein
LKTAIAAMANNMKPIAVQTATPLPSEFDAIRKKKK